MTNTHSSFVRVHVVFAEPGMVWQKTLSLPNGATVGQAFAQSGFMQECPDLATQVAGLGVYGQRCPETHLLNDGDRVELYRGLRFDPKESRRRRAAHKQRVKNANRPV